ALFDEEVPENEFEAVKKIVEKTGLLPHKAVATVQGLPILHQDHITPEEGLMYLEGKLFSKKHIRLKKPSS
ncbi:MAG: hypothetical protein ACK4TN_01655, partial [Brevinematales bacterium]